MRQAARLGQRTSTSVAVRMVFVKAELPREISRKMRLSIHEVVLMRLKMV